MSKYIFLFDLDSTITYQEVLPTIAKEFGIYEKLCSLTNNVMKDDISFNKSFLQKVELLKYISVSDINDRVSKIPLNNRLISFIKRNKERCYIITENLDIWIEKLILSIGGGVEKNIFCSKAIANQDYIQNITSIIDKNIIVNQMTLPCIAIGSEDNDVDMISIAEIGIGYGGIKKITSNVLSCVDYAIYDEKKLASFLEKLL